MPRNRLIRVKNDIRRLFDARDQRLSFRGSRLGQPKLLASDIAMRCGPLFLSALNNQTTQTSCRIDVVKLSSSHRRRPTAADP